jgi:hypothetical protein
MEAAAAAADEPVSSLFRLSFDFFVNYFILEERRPFLFVPRILQSTGCFHAFCLTGA